MRVKSKNAKNGGEAQACEDNSLSGKREKGFVSGSGVKWSLDGLVGEVVGFMGEKQENFYRLVIGSDSQTRRVEGREVVDFVTVVVIHRVGKGGRYFWRKRRERKRYFLRDKIYMETTLSLELAQELVPKLKRRLNGEKYVLEIHIDVGEAGPTREMIGEVVGMVTGNGFTAKIKPEGYGAFVVADRHA